MLKQFYEKDKIEVGLDEAGRGCLFGPVCVAAVSWLDEDPEPCIEIKDSKKCSEKHRLKCYDYIIENGLSLESNYPFEGFVNRCGKFHEPFYHIGDYHIIPENNEKELMYILSNHPVLVNIQASMPFFRFYKRFNNCIR